MTMSETADQENASVTWLRVFDSGIESGARSAEHGFCLSCGHPSAAQDRVAMSALVDEVAARLLRLSPALPPVALNPGAGATMLGENTAPDAVGITDAHRADTTLLEDALVLLHEDGDVSAVYRMLLRAAKAVRDGNGGGVGADEILWSLVAACQLSGREEHQDSLERYLADSGAAFKSSVRTAVRGVLDPATSSGWLREQIELLDGQAAPTEIVRIAGASAFVGNLSDCRQALRRVACPDPMGRFGVPGVQADILLALEAYQTGQWDEAVRLAETAAIQCTTRGYQLLRRQAQTVLAFVAAARGDAAAARETADEIARWAAPRGLTSLLVAAQYACVLAALAESDFTGAHRQAGRISAPEDLASGGPFAAWVLLDLVEAAVRTDRREEADAYVHAARQAELVTLSPRMALVSTAAMAMTAPDEQASALFERALAVEDFGRFPFDRARVHLLAGERHRRMRAVGQARYHLSAAHDGFRRLGALTWVQRAATGLRAVGLAQPGADAVDSQVLSAQELGIARLAAAGLSNKEIGDRLFMSHRTVASHLYRMFPRLGITSRAALGTVLRSVGADDEVAPGQ